MNDGNDWENEMMKTLPFSKKGEEKVVCERERVLFDEHVEMNGQRLLFVFSTYLYTFVVSGFFYFFYFHVMYLYMWVM